MNDRTTNPFGAAPEPEAAATPAIRNAIGGSLTHKWAGVVFTVYPLHAEWHDVPGVYIFTARENTTFGILKPLYVGRADSLQDRPIGPRHDKWERAQELHLSAVHAMVERDERTRRVLEGDLILRLRPPLNERLAAQPLLDFLGAKRGRGDD